MKKLFTVSTLFFIFCTAAFCQNSLDNSINSDEIVFNDIEKTENSVDFNVDFNQKKSNFKFTNSLTLDYVFMPYLAINSKTNKLAYTGIDITDSGYDYTITNKGHFFKLFYEPNLCWEKFSIDPHIALNFNTVPFFFNSLVSSFQKTSRWINDDPKITFVVNLFLGFLPYVVAFVYPMVTSFGLFDLGVLFNYHPFTNGIIDTKIGGGLEMDLQRIFITGGFLNLVAQAEVSAKYKLFKSKVCAGYKLALDDIADEDIAFGSNSGFFVQAGLGVCF